jgi:Protein of unknown function (DUF1304)
MRQRTSSGTKDLAFNVGAYNLVLAIGLAWTAASQASSLGMFFTVWLLIAALAAAWTHVWLAAGAQGLLGLLLGVVNAPVTCGEPYPRPWWVASRLSPVAYLPSAGISDFSRKPTGIIAAPRELTN